MKPHLLIVLLLVLGVAGCRLPVSESLVHEGNSVSDFNMDLDYEVWLPDGYDKEPTRSYPVLVWFHGGGENELGWGREGRIGTIVQERVKKGELQPFIVVSPSAGTFQPIFRTYDKLVVDYMLPQVEKKYRTNGTVVAFGHSMGGLSALIVALKHPDLFKAAVIASPFVFDTTPWDTPEEKREFDETLGGRFNRNWRYQVGMNFSSREKYDQWSPYSLVRRWGTIEIELLSDGAPKLKPVQRPQFGKLLLTVGDKDQLGLLPHNTHLHELMAEHGIVHEWYVQKGVGHGTVEDPYLMDWLNEQAGD
ncbi:MAG: alpha/beta fold hydrolase [Planctomycetes bacterium]|nr:alpha/beta fold hydrolase [Planctomycetota bacterium]